MHSHTSLFRVSWCGHALFVVTVTTRKALTNKLSGLQLIRIGVWIITRHFLQVDNNKPRFALSHGHSSSLNDTHDTQIIIVRSELQLKLQVFYRLVQVLLDKTHQHLGIGMLFDSGIQGGTKVSHK